MALSSILFIINDVIMCSNIIHFPVIYFLTYISFIQLQFLKGTNEDYLLKIGEVITFCNGPKYYGSPCTNEVRKTKVCKVIKIKSQSCLHLIHNETGMLFVIKQIIKFSFTIPHRYLKVCRLSLKFFYLLFLSYYLHSAISLPFLVLAS